jgi:parallel beta-helix repeat protein
MSDQFAPPTDRRALLAGIGGLAAGTFLTAGRAEAGPLNPPGAPASTNKPLEDVEPRIALNTTNTPADATCIFKITKPGSYYLTENLVGRAGRHGILISADHVTLDLMGFMVQGGEGTLTGITVDVVRNALVVRNGNIVGWGEDGIDFQVTGALRGDGSLIEGVESSGNSLVGIRGNHRGAILRCTARANGNVGISAGEEAHVDACLVTGNLGTGMTAGVGSVVTNCRADGNTLGGISLSNRCSASHCTAITNGATGISASGSSSLLSCASSGNSSWGFSVSVASNLSGCVATLNQGIGFGLEGASAFNCRAHDNGTIGFLLDAASTLNACVTMRNGQDGIRASDQAVVRACNCYRDGNDGDGAGIHVTGSDNRIEDNNCLNADYGIRVTGTGNFIARNTCSANTTNWDIAAGNVCLVISATTAAAFSGNSGGASPGSTNPNANYTY